MFKDGRENTDCWSQCNINWFLGCVFNIWSAQSSKSLDRRASPLTVLRRDWGNVLRQHSDANVTQLVLWQIIQRDGEGKRWHYLQICDNAPACTATACEVGSGEWRRGATHEIDAVHLAQREMTADYSAMPLSTSVFTLYHPWLP